jgi:hypothetical protein
MNQLLIWNDDRALADLIAPLMPKAPLLPLMPWHQWWGHGFTEEHPEDEAIAAAKQGNFKLLGVLMNPPNHYGRPKRLSWEAEKLIAQYFQGTFKAQKPSGKNTGKKTRRPVMTEAQRRAKNPTHDAAKEVPIIENLLRQLCPGQRGYRERAIDMAAYRAGIDRDRLANHPAFKRKKPSPP